MFSRWKYNQVNDGNLPLDSDQTYTMDLVGADFRNGEACPLFYGWVNGVRVFVDGKRGSHYCAGDSVEIAIRGYSDRSAFAEVVGINSCFLKDYIDTGRKVNVWKCQQSRRDLRDVAGTLKFGKSESGIFTIVPSTKMEENDFFRGMDVKIEDLKRDKNGRYLVIAQPVVETMKRNNEKEIFVGEWPSRRSEMPTFGEMSAKPGIPSRELESIFYACSDGKRYIMSMGGLKLMPSPNGHELSDADAMRYYISRASGRPENIKIALFDSEREIDVVERAKGFVRPVSKDFVVEELPITTLL